MKCCGVVASDESIRTPIPSELQRLFTLVRKELRNDFTNTGAMSKLLVRIVLPPLFMALYGISFLSEYNSYGSSEATGNSITPQSSYSQGLFTNGLNEIGEGMLVLGGAQGSGYLDIYNELINLDFVSNNQLSIHNASSTASDFVSYLDQEAGPNNFSLGIFVSHGSPDWAYSIVVNGSALPDPEVGTSSSDAVSDWASSGVLSAQYAMNQAISSIEGSVVSAETLVSYIQGLPKRGGTDADITTLILPSLYILLGVQFALNLYLTPMMRDRRTGIVRGLILMGVAEVTYWNHWVAYHLVDGTIIAGLMTLVFFVMKYVVLASPGFVFLCFLLFMVGTSQYAVLIPHLIKQDNVASLVPFISWLFFAGISSILVISGLSQPALTVFTFLHPWFGAYQCVETFVRWDWEGKAIGVVASTAVESGMAGIIGAQIGQIVFYHLIITQIYKPARVKASAAVSIDLEPSEDDLGGRPEFEKLPDGAEPLLRIRGLRKEFELPGGALCAKRPVVKAVNGLDMTVLKGEIFGFLGHNSSGKTTTLSMIAGEFLPTAGAAELHFQQGTLRVAGGKNDIIRNHIGVCAQEDLLFEEMTCRQHLELFAKLKGGIPCMEGQSTQEAIAAEVERRIEQVNFTTPSDVDKPVTTYSGGMKRRVSIAIAFLGNPELVMLDEPTAGVDSYGRRAIWDMIAASKQGRSIILTTHFMDEADILSDRIGILNHGRMVACGTNLFLKHHFGAGYTLKYLTPNHKVAGHISSYIPQSVKGAEIKLENNLTFHWRLPSGAEASFASLLEHLDESGCYETSLELTTLEEVFLKTGSEAVYQSDSGLEEANDTRHDQVKDQVVLNMDSDSETDPVEQLRLIWTDTRGDVESRLPVSFLQKIRAMAVALYRQSGRSLEHKIFGTVLPIVYIIIAFVLVYVYKESDELITVDPVQFDGASIFDAIDGAYSTAKVFNLPNTTNWRSISVGNDDTFVFVNNGPSDRDNLSWYVSQGFVIGGYINSNSTLFYNTTVSVSIPVMYGLLANSTLNTVGASVLTEVRGLSYYPTPSSYDFSQFMLALFIGLGFVPLGYIVIGLAEIKEKKLYTFARLHGINRFHIFTGAAANGVLTSWLIFFIVALILAFAFKNPLVGSGGRWLAFILLCIAYAFSVLPLGLAFEPLFATGSGARDWMPVIMIFLLAAPYAIYGTMPIYASASAQRIMGDIMSILPPFSFQRGLSALFGISNNYNDSSISWYSTWNFDARVSYSIVLMIVMGIVLWIIVFLQVRHSSHIAVPGHQQGVEPEDDDVCRERNCVLDGVTSGDQTLRVKDIVKTFLMPPDTIEYKVRFFTLQYWIKRLFNAGADPYLHLCKRNEAVKGLSFSVPPNSIFALLGPNGSGKSVTASSIVRDISLGGGDVYIDGVSLREASQIDDVYARGSVAYCPQHDALFSQLTVQEHLEFVLSAHHMSKKDPLVESHVNAVLDALNLHQHTEKLASKLSGGYKRRLCLALALIAKGEVMLIDEVSSGIDPAGRHQIWSILKPELAIRSEADAAVVSNLRLPGILLSTHYMDEAQVLANKIGIMVNGSLLTIGSLAKLQDKHCNKIFADLTFTNSAPPEEQILAIYAKSGFNAEIVEAYSHRVKLQINLENHSQHNTARVLASAFRFTESVKSRLQIKLYNLAVMDLEKIFIELSKQQFDKERLENPYA